VNYLGIEITALNIADIVKKPIVIHLVAEIGAGKSTFIKLLQEYEGWLSSQVGLEGKLIYPFPEDFPKKMWEEYQTAIIGDKQNPVVFKVQSWFMNQKLALIYRANGQDYPGAPGFYSVDGKQGDYNIPSRLMKYDFSFRLDRQPGFYLVERDPREDFNVFAARYESKFPLRGNTFAKYRKIYGPIIEDSPSPDIIVRLNSNSKMSMKRVEERGTMEKLVLEDYEEMEARYTLFIDSWIRKSRIPCIQIDTSLDKFDYNKPDGQQYLLTAFFRGMKEYGFWCLNEHRLPIAPLLSLKKKK
jgi:deoxyadenosine/deoxycytidine kinase